MIFHICHELYMFLFVVFDIFYKFSFSSFNHQFSAYDFFVTRNRYHLISRSLHLCFRSISKISIIFNFGNFSLFVIVAYLLDLSFLRSAIFLTPLYLGKNYAYRKRIVKHISKLRAASELST